MIVVTGGAGFIGSNLIKRLNSIGIKDLIIIDNLNNKQKKNNLKNCIYTDLISKENFIDNIEKNRKFFKISKLFHLGACTDTKENNLEYLLFNNYEYSKKLLHYSIDNKIDFIYSSSAAIYGKSKKFNENIFNYTPLNYYGLSKYLFDIYTTTFIKKIKTKIIGLRYFNVYGPYEFHKQQMSSVIYNFYHSLIQNKKIKIFGGYDGFSKGEHLRDFVYVDDVIDINLFSGFKKINSGIYNVGSGKACSFNDVAKIILKKMNKKKQTVKYVSFPNDLKSKYQTFTKSNNKKLDNFYQNKRTTLKKGISKYIDFLNNYYEK